MNTDMLHKFYKQSATYKIISGIFEGEYSGSDEFINLNGKIIMPGFIDVHIHGSAGIDFMDAEVKDFKTISESLYNEGVTTYLATTLTSDKDSLARVCKTIKAVKDSVGKTPVTVKIRSLEKSSTSFPPLITSRFTVSPVFTPIFFAPFI